MFEVQCIVLKALELLNILETLTLFLQRGPPDQKMLTLLALPQHAPSSITDANRVLCVGH